jgi:hypothetical protein
MDMLAEPFDPGHVLVQGDAPEAESGPSDLEVFEQDGLEFPRSHEIDIGFVRIRAK